MKLEFESNSASLPLVDPQQLEEWVSTDESSEVNDLLRQGIKAAQEGDRTDARVMLLRVTDEDPENESAWMWLASISEYPEELLVFLNNVLRINPGNERAAEWAAATASLLANSFVQRGVDAAEDGQDEYAKQCFMQAIVHDDRSEMAWQWMASIADSEDEKHSYLHRVLSINPDNETALSVLEEAKAKELNQRLIDANRMAISGERDDAVSHLETLLSEAPELEDGWMLRAHLADGFDEKIQYFRKVLEINEENQVAKANLESLDSIVSGTPDSGSEADVEDADGHFSEMSTAHYDVQDEIAVEPDDEDDVQQVPDESFEQIDEEAEVEAVFEDVEEFVPEEIGDFGSVEEEEAFEMSGDNDFESVSFDEPGSDEEEGQETPVWEEISDGAESPDDAADDEEPSAFDGDDGAEVEDPEVVASDPVDMPIEQPESIGDLETEDEPEQTDPDAEEDSLEFDSDEMEWNAMTDCPFCRADLESRTFACDGCGVVLSVSDLELLLSNGEADGERLSEAVNRMETEKNLRGVVAHELRALGIGYINLKQYRKGLEYLQEFAAKHPNDVVFRSQVDALAVRVSEIEEKEDEQFEPPKSKKILVVDDSPTIRKLIALKLEKCGHEAICAVDGVDAIEKINEAVPDLILLDITMPRMDGYQVCKLIRGNEATKEVPVVMISGKDGFFDKVRGKMAGTTNYITKPFGPETLMRTVNEYLS